MFFKGTTSHINLLFNSAHYRVALNSTTMLRLIVIPIIVSFATADAFVQAILSGAGGPGGAGRRPLGPGPGVPGDAGAGGGGSNCGCCSGIFGGISGSCKCAKFLIT